MDPNHIQKADILISAVRQDQYPDQGLPEVALAGRSNVGKSSFINSMVNRKKLAHTSSKPGKTRTLNFYQVENELLLVDVPGYGFAKVSKAEQNRWAAMMEEYFASRESLVLVIQLVDFRHKPSQLDIQMYEYLSHFNLPVLVVATKADKVKPSKRDKQIQDITQALNLYDGDQFMVYSAESKEGRDQAWQIIREFLRDDQLWNF